MKLSIKNDATAAGIFVNVLTDTCILVNDVD